MATDQVPEDFYASLAFGLRQLARAEETDDPHIQSESEAQALVTFEQLARDIN